jgi:hypothetical protein
MLIERLEILELFALHGRSIPSCSCSLDRTSPPCCSRSATYGLLEVGHRRRRLPGRHGLRLDVTEQSVAQSRAPVVRHGAAGAGHRCGRARGGLPTRAAARSPCSAAASTSYYPREQHEAVQDRIAAPGCCCRSSCRATPPLASHLPAPEPHHRRISRAVLVVEAARTAAR